MSSSPQVTINLYASLRPFTPENADRFPISPGQTVKEVLIKLEVPLDDVQLIFIDGAKAALSTPLNGGERVGVFPPVGGG